MQSASYFATGLFSSTLCHVTALLPYLAGLFDVYVIAIRTQNTMKENLGRLPQILLVLETKM